jgi:SnoaL-like domain
MDGPPETTVGARAVAYLEAVAAQDWPLVEAVVSARVRRHGPFGDDVEGREAYLAFLEQTMPSLPGYHLDIDRVSEADPARCFVELRETITVDGNPMVTHECLVVDLDDHGRIDEVAIYIRRDPQGHTGPP